MAFTQELRAELRKMTDEQLRSELANANIGITRGMIISRAGVNAELKIIAEIESEQRRRAANLEHQKTVQWLTTKPSGRSHTHSADDGVTGWRLHAVEATKDALLSELKRKSAVCGLRPRTGWGLDLFIDARCTRCEKKLGLR
jgi:hypothetical protein